VEKNLLISTQIKFKAEVGKEKSTGPKDAMNTPYQVPAEVMTLVNQAHHAQQPVVLATGVFDLLHEEHVTFLRRAKAEGGILIVGVESDSRVKTLKGPDRPCYSLSQRLEQLRNLELAEIVFGLPETFGEPEVREALIAQLRPSILAVSSHSPHLDKKEALVVRYGGHVKVVHQHNPAISTTQLLAKGVQQSPVHGKIKS
jgi:rfaE bifunctional protein nucleotidyltransferase chain/domain